MPKPPPASSTATALAGTTQSIWLREHGIGRLIVAGICRLPDLWRAPGAGQLQDFTQDGRRPLFLRVDADAKMVLLQIDVDRGVATRIHPAKGMAKLTSAANTADGRGIEVAQERAGKPGRQILLGAGTLNAALGDRALTQAAPQPGPRPWRPLGQRRPALECHGGVLDFDGPCSGRARHPRVDSRVEGLWLSLAERR